MEETARVEPSETKVNTRGFVGFYWIVPIL